MALLPAILTAAHEIGFDHHICAPTGMQSAKFKFSHQEQIRKPNKFKVLSRAEKATAEMGFPRSPSRSYLSRPKVGIKWGLKYPAIRYLPKTVIQVTCN